VQLILAALGVFFTATSAFSTLVFCRAARAGHQADHRLVCDDDPDTEASGRVPAGMRG
jgi:hypothetical protein